MSDFVPKERDLPPGRRAARREHLLSEITRPSPERRLTPRLIAVASAACAVVAAFVLTVALTRGTDASASSFLVASIAPSSSGGNEACDVPVLPFGCSGPAVSSRQADLDGPPRVSETIEIVGGTERQQEVLRTIVEATRPTAIRRIEITPRDGDGVLVRMSALDASGLTSWQELVVAGAFRLRAHVDVSLQKGDSNGAPVASGSPDIVASAGPAAVERARERFEASAHALGFELDELTVYRPAGVAVSATISTDDPAAFLVREMPAFIAWIGDLWGDYEGVHLRLEDEDGSTVWEAWSAGRTSTGSVAARLDIAACSPIAAHGGNPPPCPVSAAETQADAAPLTVMHAPTPDFDVSDYVTSGSYPQVSGGGIDLTAVNAALLQAVLDDQDEYAASARKNLAGMPENLLDIYDGTYATTGGYYSPRKHERVSASTEVVSVLIPNQTLYPGGNHGAGWISATIDVSSGARVGLSDLFESPTEGRAALALFAKLALRAENDCMRRSLSFAGDRDLEPGSGSYRDFALMPDGLVLGFHDGVVGYCYRIALVVPYAALRPFLSDRGKRLIAGVRAPE